MDRDYIFHQQIFCGVTLVRLSGCVRRSLRACCLGGLARGPFFSNGTSPGPRSVILWTCLSRARLARGTLHGYPYS